MKHINGGSRPENVHLQNSEKTCNFWWQ